MNKTQETLSEKFYEILTIKAKEVKSRTDASECEKRIDFINKALEIKLGFVTALCALYDSLDFDLMQLSTKLDEMICFISNYIK